MTTTTEEMLDNCVYQPNENYRPSTMKKEMDELRKNNEYLQKQLLRQERKIEQFFEDTIDFKHVLREKYETQIAILNNKLQQQEEALQEKIREIEEMKSAMHEFISKNVTMVDSISETVKKLNESSSSKVAQPDIREIFKFYKTASLNNALSLNNIIHLIANKFYGIDVPNVECNFEDVLNEMQKHIDSRYPKIDRSVGIPYFPNIQKNDAEISHYLGDYRSNTGRIHRALNEQNKLINESKKFKY